MKTKSKFANLDQDFGLDTSKDKEMDEDLDINDDKDLFDDNMMFDDFDDGSQSTLKKHNDLLKDLTNFKPFIKDKVNGWLGMRWSEKDKGYVNDVNVEPIMNEKCAAWCIDYLKTYARENNLITDIGKQDYMDMHLDIIDVVWTDIGTRMEHFGIKSNADLHRICVEIEHAAILILLGAGEGKYNKFFSSSTSRHETVNLSNQEDYGRYPSYNMKPNKKNLLRRLKAAFGGA